jgi:hypothetical protein
MLNNITASYLNSYNLGGSTTVSGSHISGGLVAAYFIFVFILAVFYIVTLWKVFVKAGRPGWAAIVPIYNGWVFFEISGKPGWWALFAFLGFIPIIGSIPLIVLALIASLELAKRFGKTTVFAVVLMWLFSFIGLPILAFGDAKYTASPNSSATKPEQSTTPLPPTFV